jgi:hypothetical protein
VTIRRSGLALALTALVPFLAACGGGSKNAAEPLPTTTPTLTVPGDSKTPTVDNSASTDTTTTDTTTSTGTATTTTPAQTTPQSNPGTAQGGAAAPQTGGATTPDSPQNDTAPPANSPASKFEQFCKENPGAC